MRALGIACLGAGAPLLPLAAQDPLPAWKLDPYTRNEPALMAKVGYASYGPFAFGQRGHEVASSAEIEQRLSYAEILWVETAHFHIGLNLPEWRLPDEIETRRKIRAELERLHAILPRVNPRARVLDPWLRLHLTAMRLEDVYGEFQAFLGVSDSDFPADKSKVISGQGRYMGYGPYLGMASKYLIFVTTKTGTYLDYQQAHIGKTTKFGQRWHFTDVGALFYGVALDMDDGRLRHDTALHNDLIFNTVHGLCDGFRHYSYDLPVWIREGLAHWFERRNDPRWNTFTQNEGGLADKRPLWRWEPETRRLVAAGKGTPFSEMYTWRDYSQIAFEDHILMWSRWDFLMTKDREQFARFMFAVKGRVDPKTWLVDQADLVGATREALREIYGLSPLALDEEWRAWVLKTYPEQ